MRSRNLLEAGLKGFAGLWVVTMMLFSVVLFSDGVDPDARVLVAAVFAVCLALGVAALVLMHRGMWRLAGLAIILTVATPSGFAYIGNVLALFVGLFMLLAGSRITERAPKQMVSHSI